MVNKLGSQRVNDSSLSFNVESLEYRLLMSAPTFVTAPADLTWDSTGGVVIPVNADDADGDPLTVTATCDNPNFIITVPSGDRFARIYFKAPQVWGTTIGSHDANQTFTLSVVSGSDSKDVTYTALITDTTATIATKLVAAWNDATNTLAASIVASTVTLANGDVDVYLAQKTVGQTFTVSTGGTGTFSNSSIVQETFSGSILVQLFTSRPLDSAAANRFIDLATNKVNADKTLDPAGPAYYTNVNVHRVIDGFMMQTGDGTNGNGTGNSLLPNLPDAFDHTMTFATKGLLAMANTGAMDSSNSQWFITDGSNTYLDAKYIIFGQMVDDGGIFDKLMSTPVISNGNETSKPAGMPILDHVEMLAANDPEVTQHASVFVVPKDNDAGTGTVTITLSDGTNPAVTDTVAVNARGISKIRDITLAPGGQTTLDLTNPNNVENPTANDSLLYGGTDTATVTVASKGLSAATVTIDSATNIMTVKVPDSYSGAFPVTLTLSLDPGTPNDTSDDKTFTRTFYVVSRNVSDPDYLDSFENSVGNGANGTCVVGNRLYVAQGDAGVMIYDITDTAHPSLLGVVATQGRAWDVNVVNNTLYVTAWAQQQTQSTWGIGGFESWDISNLGNIHMLDSVPLDSASLAAGALPAGFAINGNVAYVAEYGRGLVTYDITDPSNMKELDVLAATTYLNPQDQRQFIQMSGTVDVAVSGNYVYVSDVNYGAIWIIGASNPRNLIFKSGFGAGGPFGIEVSDGKLYVASNSGGMLVYSTGSSPKLLGSCGLSGATYLRMTSVTKDSVTKEIAVVTTQDGTAMVDVTDPKAMGLYYVSDAGSAGLQPAVSGSTAYLFSTAGAIPVDLSALTDFVSKKDLTFVHNGVTVHVVLKGAGSITLPPDQASDPTTLDISGTGSASTVTITTTGGVWSPDKITLHSYVGSFTATTTQTPALYLDGVGTLKLGDLPGGGTISLGGGSGYPATAVTMGDVKNLAFTTDGNVRSLTVSSWTDNDATKDTFAALTVGKLVSKGEFDPNVTLSGASGTLLTSATIGGLVKSSAWDLSAGNAGTITATGSVQDWALTAENLTKATLGAVSGKSTITVTGTGTGQTAVPGVIGSLTAASWAASGDDANKAAITSGSIKSLKITGEMAADLTINGTAGVLNLPSVTMGSVTGGTWTVDGNAGTVKLGSIAGWTATMDDIKKLAVTTDMTGTLTAVSVGTMSVGGNMTSSTVSLTKPISAGYPKVLTLGKLTVAGAVTDSTINSAGHIGSVTAGAILGASSLTAGVKDPATHAQAPADFDAQARIDSVTIKGLKVAKGQPAATAFSGWISASTLGKVKVVNALAGAQASDYGISCKAMTSYTYTGSISQKWSASSHDAWPDGFDSFKIIKIPTA